MNAEEKRKDAQWSVWKTEYDKAKKTFMPKFSVSPLYVNKEDAKEVKFVVALTSQDKTTGYY